MLLYTAVCTVAVGIKTPSKTHRVKSFQKRLLLTDPPGFQSQLLPACYKTAELLAILSFDTLQPESSFTQSNLDFKKKASSTMILPFSDRKAASLIVLEKLTKHLCKH